MVCLSSSGGGSSIATASTATLALAAIISVALDVRADPRKWKMQYLLCLLLHVLEI